MFGASREKVCVAEPVGNARRVSGFCGETEWDLRLPMNEHVALCMLSYFS
jgi:hypothetical protein